MRDKQFIEQQGQRLYDALRTAKTLAPLTDSHPEMTVEDAYHISLHMLRLREAGLREGTSTTSAPANMRCDSASS